VRTIRSANTGGRVSVGTSRRARNSCSADTHNVELVNIQASAAQLPELDAIEHLMFDVIETLMARGTARQSAPGNGAVLLARRLRDSNR